MDNYIIPPTVSGNPHKIYRTDNTTTVTYNYKDSIRRDIDNGAMMVNFQGHAGNSNWEDGMQDPNTLNISKKASACVKHDLLHGKLQMLRQEYSESS